MPPVYELAVTPGFMRALGMPLLAGRDFIPADMQAARAVIVNQAFARKYFGGQNPVGRRIRDVTNMNHDMEIVGLVRDQRYFGLRTEPQPFFYLPARYIGVDATYYVRTTRTPESMIPSVRKIVEQQAPGVPVIRLGTMKEQVSRLMGSEKQIAALARVFGILATALAAIGLYGVMAYTVTRRTREIGIRMALGAASSEVIVMVIREVATIVGIGLLIGIPSGLAVSHLTRSQSQLYGVSPTAPGVLIAAAVVVAGVALCAGLLPARRAARIDPMQALRWE